MSRKPRQPLEEEDKRRSSATLLKEDRGSPMTDILEQIRDAFDASNELYVKKNIALRKAHSEIERLRTETGRLRAIVRVNLMRSLGASHEEIDAILDPPDRAPGYTQYTSFRP
jgi:hypothetical protein